MREEALKLEKVKKSCSTTKKVLGIFKVLLIVVSVICLVGAGICFGMKKQINTAVGKEVEAGNVSAENFNMDLTNGIFHYEINEDEMIASGDFATPIALTCVFAAVMVAVMAVLFALLQKIFVIMEEEESPFSPAVLQRIKRVFIAIAVIMGIEVGIGIGLFLGLFFWCLYCILDYGYALQKEVDETL